MSNVYVLGGGVAGLTVAHELVERGFTVHVFERHPICGGKARSMKHAGSGTGGRADLPGEHGFRFFPGFYWHMTETMSRIWVDQDNGIRVVDNLVGAEKIGIAQVGKSIHRLEAGLPGSVAEWFEALLQLFANPSLGVPLGEATVFARKLLCFLGAGPTRRAQQYEALSWWDFTEAATKSTAYQNVLARGLSRSLVAMRPEKASTTTVASMLVQMLCSILDPPPGMPADRVLNAPTNEAWIDPWVAQLQSAGVTIHTNCTVKAVTWDAAARRMTGITVATPGGDQVFGTAADCFVAAVPVEVMQKNVLFPPAFKTDAGLNWTGPLGEPRGVDQLETDWMSGVLFYLNRQASALKGHIIHATSPWALTSLTQAQFWNWNASTWANHGDGTSRDILSAIISDWERVGDQVITKPAHSCTREELLTESWAQLKAHMAAEPLPGRISDADLVDRFVDPAITFDAVTGVVNGNDEPLLINTINSRHHRPPARTAFPNFFVAADWVKTITDLACMEAANEAARQAVNALLDQTGSMATRCAITPLKEPAIFEPFRTADETLYVAQPASPPILCAWAANMGAAGFSGGTPPGPGPSPGALDWTQIAILVLGIVNVILLLALLAA